MPKPTSATCCLILGISVALTFAQPADDAGAKLQGEWTATKAQRDGKPADDVIGHRLTFTTNRFQIQSGERKTLHAGAIRLDPGARPPAIDFAHAEGDLKDKTWKGIYALDGDTLTICDNAPDPAKDRPMAFEAKSDSGYVLITFQRGAR